MCFPDEESLICPPGKSISYHKKGNRKKELVSRPDRHQLPVYGDVMKAEYQEIRDSYQRADRLCQDGRMSKQIRHEMNRCVPNYLLGVSNFDKIILSFR